MTLREFLPGRSCRIQLRDDNGRLSGVWTIFSAKHSADLYVVPRFLGGAVKISLHASGSWQVGYTSEHRPSTGRLTSRHWELWRRGSELGEGIVRGWYLVISESELRPGTPDPKAHQLPPVGADSAASLEILFMANHGPTPVIDNAHLVGRWPLTGTNECCVVLARRIPWTADLQEWINELRLNAGAQAAAAGVVVDASCRYFFHGHDAAGVRFGVEAAGSAPAQPHAAPDTPASDSPVG